ncbi:MAG: leucyl aminopeptidase [Desulfovibrio sp.]|nr:leucyl aminopeptidase [Desulfovibrio sp.]
MEIKIQVRNPDAWKAQAVIVPCCENENLVEQYPELDRACPWLAIAPAVCDFRGENGEIEIFYGHPDLQLPRVMAIGLGKRSDFSPGRLREGLAAAARKCVSLKLENCLFPTGCLEKFDGGAPRLLREGIYGFLLGLYEFSLKSEKSGISLKTLELACAERSDQIDQAAKDAEILAWATSLARDLDNLPGNMLYPEQLALRATELALANGVKCEVYDKSRLEELGAGCLLAVGQGSSHPPRLVVLEYAPAGLEKDRPLALVGKGITFDSGGLCLKPAANMAQMKCDMSGAAACLAAIIGAAKMKIRRRLVAILTCAENMPDGGAYRPGDVLTALDGQTVEVINTDAEGRLGLADALAFVCRNFEPEAIVDIATLTGACAVALGNEVAGLFSTDDALAAKIAALGEIGGENFWRMPLWPGYRDSLKSRIADISHTASREGGAITAALFLKNFVSPDIPWSHLDIAGVDWKAKSCALCPEGATGFGARTLLELARQVLA